MIDRRIIDFFSSPEIEGINLERHLVNGIPHIFIGHNLAVPQTEEELAIIGSADIQEGTEEQAYELFAIDYNEALDDAKSLFDTDDIPGNVAQETVIVSMIFQLGYAGFKKFKNFIAAVEQEDWETAAIECRLKEEEGMGGIKVRNDIQAEMLRTGRFPGEAEEVEEEPEIDDISDNEDRMTRLENDFVEVKESLKTLSEQLAEIISRLPKKEDR